MEELKQALADIAATKGTPLKAVIVDDDVDMVDVPPLAEWVSLKDRLETTSPLHDELLEHLVDLGHNPEEPPAVETLRVAIERLQVAPQEDQRNALEVYIGWESVLRRMRRFLENLGFEVECYASKPTFDGQQLPFLCLVDYQIVPELESGDTAVRLFQELMVFSEAQNRPPPFVILMSKALSEADVDKWTNLAERAGLFRFNYGFLNKEQFLRSASYLNYPLLYFVKHDGLSRAYFLQMNSLVSEAQGIAKKVSRQLLQVTPPEALLFRDRLFKEGSSLASELSSLFAELFSAEIQASPSVVVRMKELEEVVTNEGIPVPYRQQRSALHKVYAELLHQKCDDADHEPCFGDIFANATGTYFLVLSQECDLATGEARPRKTDRVIAIEGELKNAFPQNAGEMIIVKPIIISGSDQRLWLCWDLGRPVVLPLTKFSETLEDASSDEDVLGRKWALNKRWKLRFADAEDIQHKFATRMTRVALSVMPEFVHVHAFRLSLDNEIIDDAPGIYIYQVQEKFALAPESQGTCHAADNGQFMSDALIEKLSSFVAHETFRKALEGEQLMPLVEGSDLLLAKTTSQFRRGRKAWKGLA